MPGNNRNNGSEDDVVPSSNIRSLNNGEVPTNIVVIQLSEDVWKTALQMSSPLFSVTGTFSGSIITFETNEVSELISYFTDSKITSLYTGKDETDLLKTDYFIGVSSSNTQKTVLELLHLKNKPATTTNEEVYISSNGYNVHTCGWSDVPCNLFGSISSNLPSDCNQILLTGEKHNPETTSIIFSKEITIEGKD